MSGWIIFLDIVLILIFLITAVLITISSVNLYKFKNLDSFFTTAYNYSVWASVISWLIVALFIAAIIGGVAFFAEAGVGMEAEALVAQSQNNSITGYISGFALFFLFIILVLIFIIGVLSALTANNIRQSSNFSESNSQMSYAYHSAIAAAVLALLSSSIVFLWWIVDLVYYFNPPENNLDKTEIKN